MRKLKTVQSSSYGFLEKLLLVGPTCHPTPPINHSVQREADTLFAGLAVQSNEKEDEGGPRPHLQCPQPRLQCHSRLLLYLCRLAKRREGRDPLTCVPLMEPAVTASCATRGCALKRCPRSCLRRHQLPMRGREGIHQWTWTNCRPRSRPPAPPMAAPPSLSTSLDEGQEGSALRPELLGPGPWLAGMEGATVRIL